MARHARVRLTLIAAAAVCVCAISTLAARRQDIRIGIAAPFASPSEAPADQVKGTGFITGQVVDASTSRPVSRVAVSLIGAQSAVFMTAGGIATDMSAPPGAPRQVLTDSEGRFLFRELAKGRYTIRTSAPGYVAGGAGQMRPNGPTQTIELEQDDTRLGDVTVRIWKTATITGTVTDETGEPLVRVSVTSVRRVFVNGQPRISNVYGSTTDDRGAYRISNLIPGDYVVGLTSALSTTPVSVVDAYREMAVSGANLTQSELFRELSASGATMAMSVGMGGFRVGEFMVSPGMPGMGSGGAVAPAPLENQRMLVYPTTFYPAASSMTQASIVKLGSGETRSNIDVQIRLAPSLRVSGIVNGPDGPARNTALRLTPAGSDSVASLGTALDGAASVSDAAGAFTFFGVTPGRYTLKVIRVPRPPVQSAPPNMTTIEVAGANGMTMMGMTMVGAPGMPQPPAPPLPTEPAVWASQQVTVGDQDVTDLSVMLRPGARLSGRVQFEGTKTPPEPEQMQRVSFNLTSNESRQIGVPAPFARVEADGRFNTMGYAPGRYQVMVSVPSMPNPGGPAVASNWVFKSAMYNGKNLADDPLEIGSEDISGIVVTFTDRSSSLGGVVLDPRGQPDKMAEIVIFPADSPSWRLGLQTNRRVRTSRTSATGKYEFGNLPPGDYYAIAFINSAGGDVQDPKFLETLIGAATRVTVGDGEQHKQDLTSKQVG